MLFSHAAIQQNVGDLAAGSLVNALATNTEALNESQIAVVVLLLNVRE